MKEERGRSYGRLEIGKTGTLKVRVRTFLGMGRESQRRAISDWWQGGELIEDFLALATMGRHFIWQNRIITLTNDRA